MIRGLRRLLDREPAPPAPTQSGFDPRASAADIAACFRLILGRHPNPEERGHFARAGEELATVVASYLSSLEFSRRQLGRPSGAAPIEVTKDRYVIMVREDDLAVGRAVLAGDYEPDVSACIANRHLVGGQGVIDLGANIGAISMLAASIVGPEGYVLAVEPNPRNAHLLEISRRRNGFSQIVVCQCAAGPRTELLVLHSSFSNGTTSSMPDGDDAFETETVPAIPPERLVPPERRIDLIKADVEGAEYLALQGCLAVIRRDHPMIVSEFSPDMLAGISGIDGPSYCDWLVSLGYRLSVIEPDGGLSPFRDATGIMDAYRARGTDHIDIAARV